MYFVFQALTWGFLLVLLPVLIHLINMLRHKRVKWAAMDFLLKSYKRHRRWVWLKQFLLLLMRMAVIALLVAMLAQWRPSDWWFARFGGNITHHYVLLDDSYSMSEQAGGKSSFELAAGAIKQIGRRAVQMDGPQRFTLIRFSQAAAGGDQQDPTQIADLNAEVVDVEFDQRLEEVRRTFDVTQLDIGPRPALGLLQQLLEEPSNENRLVYLVSDFRENEWQNPAELRQGMIELDKLSSDLQLINCALTSPPNLAITDVQPAGGTQAAGVPLFVNVRIKNFGSQPVRQVQLRAETLAYDESLEKTADPEAFQGDKLPQPIKLIDAIGPGETIERRIQIFFEKPGRHVVQVQLPDDAILADNRRWAVLDITAAETVLVVDGDPEQRNAFFLQSIFEPSQRANTGIQTVLRDPRYLASTPAEELQGYTAIYLTDVQRLDQAALDHLTKYVEAGGGLAVFLGPNVDFRFYNGPFYDDGQGLFPLEVYGDVPLVREVSDGGDIDNLSEIDKLLGQPDVDIEGSTHPLFSNLLLGRNPIIRMVKVDRYVRPEADDWTPPADSGLAVLAKLHNGMPLVLEERIGSGRVVTFLTSYAPIWNDLALGPNVLVALNLQSYLAANRRESPGRTTGDPLEASINGELYRSNVTFVLPGAKEGARIPLAREARPAEGSPLLEVALGKSLDDAYASAETNSDESDREPSDDDSEEEAAATPQADPLGLAGETARSGVYELWAETTTGQHDVRRYAVNVNPAEGNLAAPPSEQLLARLAPVQPTYRHAADVEESTLDDSDFNPSLLILGILIALLIAEQIMAYSTSFHPARGAAR